MARQPPPSPPDPPPSPSDPSQALARAVRQFNTWRFWDCHETLEDLWRQAAGSPGREDSPPTGVGLADFYQGIIKLAAGFHHLLRGNHRGALHLLDGGLRLLEPLRPRCLGVDLDPLLAQVRACYDRIRELGPGRLQEFDRSLIPTIAFDPTDLPLSPQDGFLDANSLSAEGRSLRLHYLRWGNSDKPPCVLLHATGFLARLWQPIAQELSHDFAVLAYDARGHGDSDKPPNGYGWDLLALDLIAFLEALGLRDVLAVGHSSGGAAIAYAATLRPHLIGRAVLIEPIIFPRQPEAAHRDPLAAAARKRRLLWPSRQKLLHSYRSRPPFKSWRQDVLRLYVEHGTTLRQDGQAELKCSGEIEAQVYEGGYSVDISSALPQVRCPTLVLHGQHSDPMLVAAAQTVASRIPNASLAAIADATHFAPMERPEAVVAAIRAFLRKREKPRAQASRPPG